MRAWTGVIAMAVVLAAGGCAQKAGTPTAVIEDKIYTVTPDQITVKTGIVTGEVTELRITERVEQGTGRIDTPARLTGKLKLTNSSLDQSVRLVGGKMLYIDDRGQPIAFEDERTASVVIFAASYNSTDRLNPGQETTQAVELDIPAAALEANRLKEIRFELAYVPSPLRLETAAFNVSIGGQ